MNSQFIRSKVVIYIENKGIGDIYKNKAFMRNKATEKEEIKLIKLDKEYQTMFLREKDYLKEQGIYPSFKKEIDGIKIYKYTKTPQLFEALRIFYTQN